MKKMIAALCVLICLLAGGCDLTEETVQPPEAATTETTGQPQEAGTAETTTQAPEAVTTGAVEAAPARAYLLVTVANNVYEPIPLTEPGRYTVRRGDYVIVIEVTEDSVCMAESTCDNQDCVLQGTVTLENKDSRVLQNMILCLPNEVILELYTYEELKTVLPDWEAE